MLPTVSEKAQAGGIAVLILFISIILVAAIASYVLLETGNTLQQRAYSVGKKSLFSVSSHIQIINIYGYDSDRDRQDIDCLISLIRQSPGSQPIQIDSLQLIYSTDEHLITKILINTTPEDGPGGTNVESDFYFKEIKGNGNSIIESGETFEIFFVIENGETAIPIEPKKEISLTFLTSDGGETTAEFRSPSLITRRYTKLYP